MVITHDHWLVILDWSVLIHHYCWLVTFNLSLMTCRSWSVTLNCLLLTQHFWLASLTSNTQLVFHELSLLTFHSWHVYLYFSLLTCPSWLVTLVLSLLPCHLFTLQSSVPNPLFIFKCKVYQEYHLNNILTEK